MNAFLNMKLANKDDKRSFRDFKKSLVRFSSINVKNVLPRQRSKSKSTGEKSEKGIENLGSKSS